MDEVDRGDVQGKRSNVISGRGLRMGAVEDCSRAGEGDGTLTGKGWAVGHGSARMGGW